MRRYPLGKNHSSEALKALKSIKKHKWGNPRFFKEPSSEAFKKHLKA